MLKSSGRGAIYNYNEATSITWSYFVQTRNIIILHIRREKSMILPMFWPEQLEETNWNY